MSGNFDLLDESRTKEKERAKVQTEVPEILKNIDLDTLIANISKVPIDWKWGETVGELMARVLGKDSSREHYFALKNYLVAIKMFGTASVTAVENGFNSFRVTQGWSLLFPDSNITILDMWTEASLRNDK